MLELNRIYCGDCLPIMREMEDKSVDLVLTDPPYGIRENNEQNLSRAHCTAAWKRAKANDYGHSEWDNRPPSAEYFAEIFRISKNQIIFGGNYFGLPPSPCWVVWNKKTSGDFADCELAWTSFKSAVRMFEWLWNGYRQEDMIHKEERVHLTQKPIPLMMWCLEKYSKPGDLILDPFLGSGTTAVACKKMGLDFIGIEKEPAYVEIALKRLEKVNNHKITDFFSVEA